MTVLDEVKQKRDYSQYRKDCGEVGYDPAIDFYNRIIAEMESLQLQLHNANRKANGPGDEPYIFNAENIYPELREFDPQSDTSRYSKWLESENRYETRDEFFTRIVGVHKSHR